MAELCFQHSNAVATPCLAGGYVGRTEVCATSCVSKKSEGDPLRVVTPELHVHNPKPRQDVRHRTTYLSSTQTHWTPLAQPSNPMGSFVATYLDYGSRAKREFCRKGGSNSFFVEAC
jgi:hypothetical protein